MTPKAIFAHSILTAFTVLTLTACNNGDGKSGPAVTDEDLLKQAKSVTDLSASVLPNSFSVIKRNLSLEESKERFALGCKVPGQPSYNSSEMDRMLKVGQVFRKYLGFSEVMGDQFEKESEQTVVSIADKKIVSHEVMLKLKALNLPFTSVDQIFNTTPHLISTLTIEVDQNGNTTSGTGNELVNLSEAAKQYFMKLPPRTFDYQCYVDDRAGGVTVPTETTDKVYYNLNGRSFISYAVKRLRVGDIICEKRKVVENGNDELVAKVNLGPGRDEGYAVFSNDIIEIGAVSCGGSALYSSSRLVLDTGKIVKSWVDKTFAAPERF